MAKAIIFGLMSLVIGGITAIFDGGMGLGIVVSISIIGCGIIYSINSK